MRIFTKSLLTFVLLCVAGVVSAQGTVKGWFEVDASCISREPGYTELQGDHPSRVEDGAVVIYARSNEGVEGFVAWDTQFFITIGKDYALKEGGKFRLRMKVKADNATGEADTQCHAAAGTYNANLGKITFTDSWEDYDTGEITLSSDQGKNDGFYTFAINLGLGDENTFYFKDIVFEIYGDKPATPTVLSENFKWTDLINNGDAEGEDVSSFYLRTYPYTDGVIAPHAVIADGAGVDGSRAVKAASVAKVEHEWDTQFWIACNETLPAGTRIKVEFDYRADADAKTSTQAHMINPGEGDGGGSYITSSMIGDINFTTQWQKFSNDNVVISKDMSTEAKPFGSITFNMNEVEAANVYYFDNIVVQKGSLLNDVRNDEAGGIKILFTEYTNMPDLVKAIVGKKRRVVLPDAIAKAAVTVTVNGQAAPVESVEYDKDGSLYVFLPEDYAVDADAVVSVAFTNPTDEKYQLKYTRGDNFGNAVEDFEQDSEYDGEVDIIPNSWLSPELESSEPEDGSFCLPATINSFTLTFDKPVKINDKTKPMTAKLDESETLVVKADDADKSKVTLMRKPGAAALAEGKHTINITNVFSELDDAMYEDSPAELTFSVGEAVVQPKLQRALDAAKVVLENSEDARYQGDAYAELKAAVEKYDVEAVSYTKPSEVQAALDDLSGKNEAQTQHYNSCKKYDENISKLETIVAENEKFAAVPLYAVLKTLFEKYQGKVLTDDKQLADANAELDSNVKLGNDMFTTGPSDNGNCGLKVLVERVRLGAESLKANFGAADDDELVVAVDNAYTDDDELAQNIKNTITTNVYEKLAAGDASLFSETEDGEGNVTKSGPDMTVFVKNPNFYAKDGSHKGFNAENVPGWTSNLENNPGLWTSWGGARNIDGLPEDCAFTTWYGNFNVEQTVTDLPAGVYAITIYGSEWLNNGGGDNPKEINSFVYAKTSDTPAVEEGDTEDRDVNYAATLTCFHAGQYNMGGAHKLEVTVTDGKLTFGIAMRGDSQYFFSKAELTLVGPAEGVDYAAELQKFQTGVENVKIANAAVFYDLQGRRVAQPTKGLYIKNNKKVVVK